MNNILYTFHWHVQTIAIENCLAFDGLFTKKKYYMYFSLEQ